MYNKLLCIAVVPFVCFLQYKVFTLESRLSELATGNNLSLKQTSLDVSSKVTAVVSGVNADADYNASLASDNKRNIDKLEALAGELERKLENFDLQLEGFAFANDHAYEANSEFPPTESEIASATELAFNTLETRLNSEPPDTFAYDSVNASISYGVSLDSDLALAAIGEAICTSTVCKISYEIPPDLSDEERFLFDNKLYPLLAEAGLSSSNLKSTAMPDGSMIVEVYSMRN